MSNKTYELFFFEDLGRFERFVARFHCFVIRTRVLQYVLDFVSGGDTEIRV